MKQKSKLASLAFIVISSLFLLGMPYKNSLAEQNQLNFRKDAFYDIYYQVEKHIQYITSIQILDTVTLAGMSFLEIRTNVLGVPNSYIALSNIIVILPAGSPKPQILK